MLNFYIYLNHRVNNVCALCRSTDSRSVRSHAQWVWISLAAIKLTELKVAKRNCVMLQVLRVAFGVVAAITIIHFVGAATAQTPVRQIKLTEKQVQNFLAAQKDMVPVMKKMQGSTADQPDPKLQAESETITNNSGFKDFAEYDNVAANILLVVAGIDPLTKRYTDPQTVIKKGIAKVTADPTISEKDKNELLKEFEKLLVAAQPIQYPSNIQLVRKYYDKIDTALQ
jgi:hypothetical protein